MQAGERSFGESVGGPRKEGPGTYTVDSLHKLLFNLQSDLVIKVAYERLFTLELPPWTN
jgi:hypothetical protein